MPSLFAIVNADGDDGIGDERTVAAILVEQFQTAYHLHVGATVGERGSHLPSIHLWGPTIGAMLGGLAVAMRQGALPGAIPSMERAARWHGECGTRSVEKAV